MNYLYDKQFLRLLDSNKDKKLQAKIIALNLQEQPIQEITGWVTGGSINVDGASAVRRSCSLQLIVRDREQEITEAYWHLTSRFKVEIGIENKINSKYPKWIWFKQGLYVITGFNLSENTNALTISITGQDKMALLNGTVSGNIPHEVDFAHLETQKPDGSVIIEKLPLYTIIYNALIEYAQERPENIIINDLDQIGRELWEYRGDEPGYIFYNPEDKEAINMTLNNDTMVKVENKGELPINSDKIRYYSINTMDKSYNNKADKIQYGSDKFKTNLIKLETGSIAGYHQTALVYNGDLVLSAGSAITNLLDKIKTMLGNFEYFYDLDGRFVFQKKPNRLEELFSPINGEIVMPLTLKDIYSYEFNDASLFSNISKQPKLDNVKNDYTVWGARKGITGKDIPIHARYAIDKKPQKYSTVPHTKTMPLVYISATRKKWDPKCTWTPYYINDWGWYAQAKVPQEGLYYYEIIESRIYDKSKKTIIAYQTNSQYRTYKIEGIFGDKITVAERNRLIKLFEDLNNGLTSLHKCEEEDLKVSIISKTFYSLTYKTAAAEIIEDGQRYDWRELIYLMAEDYYSLSTSDEDFFIKLEQFNPGFVDGRTGYEPYYSDILGFWRLLYNPYAEVQNMWWIYPAGGEALTSSLFVFKEGSKATSQDIKFFASLAQVLENNNAEPNEYYSESEGLEKKFWTKKIHTDIYNLDFWFDFLDTEGSISQYSVRKIGRRPLVENKSSYKSIFLGEIPEILYLTLPTEKELVVEEDNYSILYIQEHMKSLYTLSTLGKSIVERINELISEHTYVSESLVLTSVPIYYLNPNTRIKVMGQDYLLDKISYSLNYNGTMNLTCNKLSTY